MAKSVNQVILIGRLTADVELRATASGKNVATFTLAVDKMGNQQQAGKPTADFFEVTAWEKLAELMQQYTSKGSKIHIIGRLNQEVWTDKESGKNRSKVTITANDITFLDAPKQAAQDTVDNNVGDDPINLDDIPF